MLAKEWKSCGLRNQTISLQRLDLQGAVLTVAILEESCLLQLLAFNDVVLLGQFSAVIVSYTFTGKANLRTFVMMVKQTAQTAFVCVFITVNCQYFILLMLQKRPYTVYRTLQASILCLKLFQKLQRKIFTFLPNLLFDILPKE